MARYLKLPALASHTYVVKSRLISLRLQYTGSWKPFHDPQKVAFDSIKTAHYVIIDWGEPHTSERFRRVNHAQQKTDKTIVD